MWWFLTKCSVLLSLAVYWLLRLMSKVQRKDPKAIAFFHPYANAGGGGERVLWQAVRCMQVHYPNYEYYVYTGDQIDEQQLVANVERSFKIQLIRPIRCVPIKCRYLVEARHYKAFTLLGQSIASFALAIECMWRLNPLLVIDTMGYAFTYWLFRAFGCRVASYTHYPTISTDMLQAVTAAQDAFNNRPTIARSRLLTNGKLLYYRAFANLYGLMGKGANVVMVNSSWTLNHIRQLWAIAERTRLVYPPCNTDAYLALPLENPTRNRYQILSLAQFRPEKNHRLQIQIVQRLLADESPLNENEKSRLKLVLVGSVRDEADRARVDELRRLAEQLNVQTNVEFRLNISFEQLLEAMRSSNIGLHTMQNEHFGIAVVESMAAGLIMVAHNSAGPCMDIIDHQQNGYLASDLDEYVEIIGEVLKREEHELIGVRQDARRKSAKFCDENFERSFLDSIKELL